MRQVLQQLADIPGVVGTLAAGPRGELLASAFPPLYDELALHQVAALFSDETSGLRSLAGPDGSLDVRYARGRVMAKPFAGGTVMALATLTADAQLLVLTLEQAARRLDAAPAPTPVAAAAAAPAAEAAPAALQALRQPLTQALVERIGPVGELVFAEAWSAWAGAAPPDASRLQALVEALAREVDDPGERNAFVAQARRLAGY